ncbi:hypothetical protein [Flavobacterium sp.]|uniref:hypothetical protein n=1 Tax=Flavobacterium sp. TaxID=239 RepID=UPI00286BA3F8|nr:hypothetical protein [Flavobacterium sp.]
MKNLLLIILFFHFSIGFSQTEPKSFRDKFEEFEYYAKPSTTNDLSRYFKRNIDYALLENYKFKDTLRKNSAVVLSFKLDKNNSVIDLEVSSPYSELNFVIKKAFETYDLKNINIPEKSPLNNYILQILSREGNKMIVNCSSDIIYDRFPVFEGCESSSTFSENRSCLNALLEEHFGKNISTDLIKKKKILGRLLLKPEFMVTESGTVEKVKWKTASDSLTVETNRIIAFFPKAKTPPTRNGNPTRLYIKEFVDLEINSANENYIESTIKSKDTTLNPNSELALHFKKFIKEQEISNYILPNDKPIINISFSLDKNVKMLNIKSNAKKQEINEKLVEVFKKFPFEKLNIKSQNVLETYYYTIFTVEHNKKIVIHCNENPDIFSESYFDQRCEKSSSPEDLKFCFQEKITNQIVKNFDTSLITQNDINNGIRLICIVQINVDGTLSRINAMNTNPKYSNELDRIIKKMPKVYRPAYWKGMPIKTTYAIPISF